MKKTQDKKPVPSTDTPATGTANVKQEKIAKKIANRIGTPTCIYIPYCGCGNGSCSQSTA